MYNAQRLGNKVVRQGDLCEVSNVTFRIEHADGDSVTLRYVRGVLQGNLWTLPRAGFDARRQNVCRTLRSWCTLDRCGDPIDHMGTVVACDATEAEIAFLTKDLYRESAREQWIVDGRLVKSK